MNKNKNLEISFSQEYELKQIGNIKILTLKSLIKIFIIFFLAQKNYIFIEKFGFFDQKQAKKKKML